MAAHKMKLHSAPPVERFALIVGILSRQRQPLSQQRIADELGVCRKTIERDIGFMRDRLNINIQLHLGRGVYLVERVQLCPICQRLVKRHKHPLPKEVS